LNNEKLYDMEIDDKDCNTEFEKVKYINKATFPNLSTPLMKAAINGHVACVRVLILAGAEKELINKKGRTAKDLVLEMKGEINRIIESSKERQEALVDSPSNQSNEGETANKMADDASLSIVKDSVNHSLP
jgi:ankyrin repeat protein